MEAYESFAAVYDELMDNVPYEDWAEHIHGRLLEQGITQGLILDMACGTGVLTRLLAQKGYDMIGVDASIDMLDIARESNGEESPILYLNQDMRQLELYGTVEAVVCVCDGLNYILEPKELLTVFRLVNNYLEAGGLFLFDMNTEYKFRELLANQTIAETREELCFIWENTYDEEERINEYALTIFEEAEDGRYERSDEFHYERAYSLEEVKKLLDQAGMEFVGAFDGYSREPLKEDSERMLILAKEGHQEKKKYC